jgi:hypothetical protein
MCVGFYFRAPNSKRHSLGPSRMQNTTKTLKTLGSQHTSHLIRPSLPSDPTHARRPRPAALLAAVRVLRAGRLRAAGWGMRAACADRRRGGEGRGARARRSGFGADKAWCAGALGGGNVMVPRRLIASETDQITAHKARTRSGVAGQAGSQGRRGRRVGGSEGRRGRRVGGSEGSGQRRSLLTDEGYTALMK